MAQRVVRQVEQRLGAARRAVVAHEHVVRPDRLAAEAARHAARRDVVGRHFAQRLVGGRVVQAGHLSFDTLLFPIDNTVSDLISEHTLISGHPPF